MIQCLMIPPNYPRKLRSSAAHVVLYKPSDTLVSPETSHETRRWTLQIRRVVSVLDRTFVRSRLGDSYTAWLELLDGRFRLKIIIRSRAHGGDGDSTAVPRPGHPPSYVRPRVARPRSSVRPPCATSGISPDAAWHGHNDCAQDGCQTPSTRHTRAERSDRSGTTPHARVHTHMSLSTISTASASSSAAAGRSGSWDWSLRSMGRRAAPATWDGGRH